MHFLLFFRLDQEIAQIFEETKQTVVITNNSAQECATFIN